MITLYNPATKTFQPTDGGNSVYPNVQVNILIELRVISALLLAQASVGDSLESLRSDAVNDSVNPII